MKVEYSRFEDEAKVEFNEFEELYSGSLQGIIDNKINAWHENQKSTASDN